ncbi:MAG: tetratricopeptide repeat protein, partial [Thermoplasmatota archaeon]
MLPNTANKIRRTMLDELGDQGEKILNKECNVIGKRLEDMDNGEITELLDRIQEDVRYFRGVDKAKEVKNSIKKYQLLEKLDDVNKERESNVKIMKKFELSRDLGDTFVELGDMDKAEKYFNDMMKMADKLDKKDMMVDSYDKLAKVYLQKGDIQKAEETIKKGLELAKKSKYELGEGKCIRRAGIASWRKGDFEESIGYFKTALEIFEDHGDEDDVASVYKNLGDVYGEMEEYDKSEEHYQKAVDFYDKEGMEYEKAVLF